MKYIDRSMVDEPASLKNQAAPSENEEIKKAIYAHKDVQNALNQLQGGICCYCETRYDATCFGDVEHFRPKGGYQQDKEDKTLHKPGYYWLAYKWDNLLYACEWCNRIYKHNYFPLKDPSKRFNPDTLDISEEEPLLINPFEEQHPEQHLCFVGTNIRAKTEKGKASITYYGLDRKELEEPRRETYNDIIAFEDMAIIAEGTALEQQMNDKLKEYVRQKLDNGQHTLMIKCNFGKYIEG
ncbi:MAG: hypothetical protein J6O49_11345 [Bacteroidaceae bacterium]|nr:hypothetical protein [Bacteroidaceae bacterium]